MATEQEIIDQFVTTHLVARKHTNAVKWDGMTQMFGQADLLPMWIADMEFKAPQAVMDALHDRIDHGVFGYSLRPNSYSEAFIDWQQTRHHITIRPEWLRFGVGVVPSLYTLVDWLTAPGDPVVIMQPVYYPFMSAIQDNHRRVVSVDLRHDDNEWHIDFERLAQTLAQQQIKLLILCSPHNPVGRIWTRAELEQLFELTTRYGVTVISDEIHGDFEINGPQFTSALQVTSEAAQARLIVLNAPSKTFNLAALLNSHLIIPNEGLRADYDRFVQHLFPIESSLMGQIAGEAAYRHGGVWLDQLTTVIRYNYRQLQQILRQGAPKAQLSPLEGTYLAFLDLGAYLKPEQVVSYVQAVCGLAVDYGEWFSPQTATAIRLNLATDPQLVKEAAQRLIAHL